MHHLMTALGLDRLSFHHTMIDTTIVAKDLDKGTGLSALRDWVMGPDAETIAIGDSEADLPMFCAHAALPRPRSAVHARPGFLVVKSSVTFTSEAFLTSRAC